MDPVDNDPCVRYAALSSEGLLLAIEESVVNGDALEVKPTFFSPPAWDEGDGVEETVALIFRSSLDPEEPDGIGAGAVAEFSFASPLLVRTGRRDRKADDRAILSVVFSSRVMPLEIDRVERVV
jgi:hypothetical protein